MKVQIKSVLTQVSEVVFKAKTLDEAKKAVTEFMLGKDINEKDKASIMKETANAKNLYKLQQYICNALLKYEGLGIAQLDKTAREAAAETAFE